MNFTAFSFASSFSSEVSGTILRSFLVSVGASSTGATASSVTTGVSSAAFTGSSFTASSLTGFSSAFFSLWNSFLSFLNSFFVSLNSFFSFLNSFFSFLAGFSSFTSSFRISSTATFFLALMTAFLLPKPRKPVLPSSITSYSMLSRNVSSFRDASRIASFTVLAVTVIYSSIAQISLYFL